MNHSGFTVLELVLVILIAGILSLMALPRLQSAGALEQHLQADNLVGLLRLSQLRAMNNPDSFTPATATSDVLSQCATVTIAATGISLAKQCTTPSLPDTPSNAGSAQLLSAAELNSAMQNGLYAGRADIAVAVSSGFSLPLRLQFGQPASVGANILTSESWLGRPFVNGSALTDTLKITVGGNTISIEPEGYIHAP